MPFTTFQTAADDHPDLDTNGRTETVAREDAPAIETDAPTGPTLGAGVEGAEKSASTPAPEHQAAENEEPENDGQQEAVAAAVEPAQKPAQEPAMKAEQEPVAEAAEATAQPTNKGPEAGAQGGTEPEQKPASEPAMEDDEEGPEIPLDAFIPVVAAKYMALPEGKPIKKSFEARRQDPLQGEASEGTVSYIDPEELKRQEAESLALSQGAPKDPVNDEFPWLKKPTPWPAFILFPSKTDLEAIRAAEAAGKLDPERQEKFNEHFEKLSILMQSRARQIDLWVQGENDPIMEKERRFPWRPLVSRNLKKLRAYRDEVAEEEQDAAKQKREPRLTADPFHDVKWGVLLNPYKSPDDQPFPMVARWGHNSVRTNDGADLIASDNGMRVAPLSKGTAQAAQLMVAEAIERGWSTIDIQGTHEFCRVARAAAMEAGLGAKITTKEGIFRPKVEFIMPRPPKFHGPHSETDAKKEAHAELSGNEGKAPGHTNGAQVPDQAAAQAPTAPDADDGGDVIETETPTGGRKLSMPGVKSAAPKAEAAADKAPAPQGHDAIDVAMPFDDDDEADAEVARALKREEDSPAPV